MDATVEIDSNNKLTARPPCERYSRSFDNSDDNIFNNMFDNNGDSCESSTRSIDEEIKKNAPWEESNLDDKKIKNNQDLTNSVDSQFFTNIRYYQSDADDNNPWEKLDEDKSSSIKDANGKDVREEQSRHPEVPLLINSFLNMENSNNAIDNNISTSKCPSEHTFKLPKSEITFNGRIKNLQKFVDNKSNELNVCEAHQSTSFSSEMDATDIVNVSNVTLANEQNDSTNVIMDFGETSKSSIVDSESNTSKTELSFTDCFPSPDIFFDDEYESADKSKLEAESLSKKFVNYDKNLIKKLEKLLQGVPPPPSKTTTQLTASEILDLYNSNIDKFNKSSEELTNKESSDPQDVSGNLDHSIAPFIGHIHSFSTHDVAAEAKWPDILNSRFFGLHYNYSLHSEDIDALLSKCISRFVGRETASSCVAAIKLTKTPVKRGLQSTSNNSPGRRLSHLARRRIVYYKANNLRDSLALKKQVLIDKKKYAAINIGKIQATRKSPRLKQTPVKTTPNKKTPKHKTPKSQGKKRNSSVKVNRGLFVDSENVVNTATSSSEPSTSKLLRSKRALFISPLKDASNSNFTDSIFTTSSQESSMESDRKRIRLDNSSASKVKLAKSFSFGGDKMENTSQNYNIRPMTRYASEQFPNKVTELSDVHKKKLLWAVAEALKAHDINIKHEHFRLYMSSLARLTRKLSSLPQHAQMFRTPGVSTSEQLLKIARQHSFSIIRGKSVDQIFSEEQLKQGNLRIGKVIGYVPYNRPEHTATLRYNENSFGAAACSKPGSDNGVKTVLQDKTVNIDTRSSNSLQTMPKSVKCGSINGKLMACRQISFDNLDTSSSR